MRKGNCAVGACAKDYFYEIFTQIFLGGNTALETNEENDSFEEDEFQLLKNWLVLETNKEILSTLADVQKKLFEEGAKIDKVLQRFGESKYCKD